LPAAALRIPEDVPDDFVPKPLGKRDEIIGAIKRIAPAARFDEPGFGIIDTAEYQIQVGIDDDVITDSFAFHLYGGKEGLLVIDKILKELGFSAIAPSTNSGRFNIDEALASYASHEEAVELTKHVAEASGSPFHRLVSWLSKQFT
jgi:hypothetical protein